MKFRISGGFLFKNKVELSFCVGRYDETVAFNVPVMLDDEGQVRVGIDAMKKWIKRLTRLNDPYWNEDIRQSNKILKVLEDSYTLIKERRAK